MTSVGCWQIFVYGRVQAVGYRDWVVAQAQSLGLDGFVRNVSDGTVEVLASGPLSAVQALERQCWTGPALARVFWLDRTVVHDQPPVAPGSGFRRLPSVARAQIR
jgi:acylphosphatase